MHGMGDNEGTLLYNNNGEWQRVFDNMIANGDIDPMIIVTPTFNKVSADTFYNAENSIKSSVQALCRLWKANIRPMRNQPLKPISRHRECTAHTAASRWAASRHGLSLRTA